MMYRYRIRDSSDASSATIEGIKLRKSTWYNSSIKIDFKAFMSMILEETAESLEEFDLKDLERIDSPEAPEEIAPVEAPSARKVPDPPAPPPVAEKAPERLSSVAAQLKARGFSGREMAGRTDAELRELLAFDTTISGRKR